MESDWVYLNFLHDAVFFYMNLQRIAWNVHTKTQKISISEIKTDECRCKQTFCMSTHAIAIKLCFMWFKDELLTYFQLLLMGLRNKLEMCNDVQWGGTWKQTFPYLLCIKSKMLFLRKSIQNRKQFALSIIVNYWQQGASFPLQPFAVYNNVFKRAFRASYSKYYCKILLGLQNNSSQLCCNYDTRGNFFLKLSLSKSFF